MGKQWDGGDIAFQSGTWRLCFDLLPPLYNCINHQAWAENNAERMRSFGYNAVAAPGTEDV